jgi:signal transduction histidine kinase
LNQLLPARRVNAVTVQSAGDVRFPPPVEIVLSRSDQEALTKATQHAKASHGEAKVQRKAGRIRSSISEGGRGFDLPAVLSRVAHHGLGLSEVQARLDAWGGALLIYCNLGHETTLVKTSRREN